jgi:protein-L-isoaspartate(D-aspartate) O-methyltransferase
MVRELERKHGISDPRVLEAMRQVPRHLFVPQDLRHQAYTEFALPIGAEQTISHPSVVARMTQLLEVTEDHSVLEIGSGSGYQTAILAILAKRVYSIERQGELARKAIHNLRTLNLNNVKIQPFDGTVGWSEMAPFDRIMVTAGAPQVPAPLLDQLAVGGLLLVPEGDRRRQHLVKYEKTKKRVIRTESGEVSFVPLVGRFGWESD